MPPKTVAPASYPARGAPTSLWVTVVATIAFGALVHYKAVISTPGNLISALGSATAVSLRRTIGVDADWLAPAIGHGKVAKTFLTLVALFQEGLKSNVVLGVSTVKSGVRHSCSSRLAENQDVVH